MANPRVTPVSETFEAIHDEAWNVQPLLRHITRVQIKDFTPFPARDALASALSQPYGQSQFTAVGSLSDDLDIAFARKRSRKISSASVATVGGLSIDSTGGTEDGGGSGDGAVLDSTGRRRTLSRTSGNQGSALGTSYSSEHIRRPPPVAGSGPTIRSHRPRTTSTTSRNSTHNSFGTSLPSLGLWPDHSQKALEKALQSRLVETFMTMTISSLSHAGDTSATALPSSPMSCRSPSPCSLPSMSPRSAPSSSRDKPPNRQQHISSIAVESSPTIISGPAKSSTQKRFSTRSHNSKVVLGNDQQTTGFTSSRAHAASTASTSSFALSGFGPHNTAASEESSEEFTSAPVPNYISPIHRSSTNPSFSIDSASGYDLAKWSNLTVQRVTINLWGRTTLHSNSTYGKGKGKQRDAGEILYETDSQWKMMGEWNVDLANLVPVPDEFANPTFHLPSNTLLVTLSSTGKTYYFPPHTHTSSGRPPSPNAGYSSDSEIRNTKLTLQLNPFPRVSDSDSSISVSLDNRITRPRKDPLRSAGWQDLVKLLTLQSVILDTQHSLSKLERDVEKLVIEDDAGRLRREVSEREAIVAEWLSSMSKVRTDSENLSNRMQARRSDLRKRRELLNQARQMQEQDLRGTAQREEELAEERTRVASLRKSLTPIRVALVTTLASIFPIDLLSGPDLLYTILDIPLPIPLGVTEPAPPLSLPSHKEVTEDGVATALGYAAHVVQLLAAYMGQGLVYPITYVGSRSLVRDGISAMVGPRMFPLFSRGVDTYRFEYGVFLLNKDIDLLMSDRNLRALDMRHTLPNLKNLLLTLTAESGREGAPPVLLGSPVFSVSGLLSPARPSSPTNLSSAPTSTINNSETPAAEVLADADSPLPSGSSTPSKSGNDAYHHSLSRMSKPFFGLSGFLRARYPSGAQQPSVKVVLEVPEGGSTTSSATPESASQPHLEVLGADRLDDDAEEDRRTLRGVAVGGGVEEELKKIGNSQVPHNVSADNAEKAVNGGKVPTQLTQIVTHMQ